jgi:hypothetical protein
MYEEVRAMVRAVRALFAFLLSALAVVVLAGCPVPTFVVQQYGGAQRPVESIAVLRVNGSDSVRLLRLDDQDVAAPIVEDGRLHIEILPGRHTVAVANAKMPGQYYPELAFQAEAGKVYRVAFGGEGARVYEVDRGKDSTVRDVTLAVPAPASAPPSVPAPAGSAADAGVPAPAVADAG